MKKKITYPSETSNLRKKAEFLLKKRPLNTDSHLSDSDTLKLIHELQVHQIELEMQNDELRRAKEIAEVATQKAEELFHFAPSGYFTLSSNGEIRELNLAGANILCLERKYLWNKRFGLFVTNETKPIFNNFLYKIFESKTKQSCEVEVSSNEILSYIFLNGVAIENSDCCFLTGVDITQRRQAEEALKENNSRLDLAMQVANMAWWGMDVSTGQVTFGEKKAEMLDYPAENFKHFQDFTRLLHPDDYDKAMNAMHAHISGKMGKYEVEYRILTKSGDYKWFYDIGSVVKRNPNGLPLYITGLVLDITERKRIMEEQKIKELKWHNLFEILPVGVSILDANSKVIDFNPALSQILDISEEGLLKGDYVKRTYFKTDFTPMSPEEFPSYRSKIENRIIKDVKIGVQKEDSSVTWTNVSAAPLPAIHGTVTVTNDITELKKTEEMLIKSEEKWRSLVSNSPDFISLLDKEGRYLFLNHYAEGFSEKEVLGKFSFDNISTESSEIFRDAFEKCIIEMTNQVIEYGGMGNNREIRMYESSLVPFVVKGDEINVLVVARDITERRKANEEIRQSREQLAQLYGHLNQVREEERTSIAREIHDDLGQSLAGLKLDLIGIKEDRLEKVDSKQKVEKAISLVDTTIKTVQKITSQLRPQMLDELGLASAIEWHSNEFKKRTGVKCILELEDNEDLDEYIAISMFRIFQAALTNIMLHSSAKSVSVKLGIEDGKLQLIVKDDGIGITTEQLNSPKSFGIIGMRERVNQINGKIEILTFENIGTEIKVIVPLKLI